MKKINILKNSYDFERIIKNNKSIKGEFCYYYIEKNNDENPYKFGISVSKKIGNAVIRNTYKRRIKSILDKNKYYNSFNCIIILKKNVLDSNYKDIEISINKDLKKLNLIKE